MVVQNSSEAGISRHAVLAALDKAMALLRPQHAKNAPIFEDLTRSVQTLTAQLCMA